MTTSAVAIIVPFVTQELFQDGDALYYGLNAKSGNMIMLDRKMRVRPTALYSVHRAAANHFPASGR